MYCYTYVNQFACIFNELQLWTRISSEHPIFLKTVASLSKINLPKSAVDELDDINKTFLGLYNDVVHLKKSLRDNPMLYHQSITNIKRIINKFMSYDTQALSFYPKLLEFAKENKVWQELVNHIIHEQNFMLELFKDLILQIC
ncbi:DUF2935 domain-containing protein [Clostridium botulinum]|uniref:DUF2935 domain-containing protein n=1 Tax=Clostridium botulinum TaxID=1491 RepID=UPI0007E251A9|nr:DUF2935 domain-containing protein [Clostridium botulinum]KEI98248.1 hypothetical protein N497_10545 [Clostridium botulinum F 357]MBE1303563.1 DUF2935 domain-containing protein [Clostridium botulinum]